MLDTYPRGRRPRGDVSSIKPTSEEVFNKEFVVNKDLIMIGP
jgi:hypothetical protein